MARFRSAVAAFVGFIAVLQGGSAGRAEIPPPPEAGTGVVAKPAAVAERHMVVAADPAAARAGLAILEAGGNALDAAVAAQMVLNVVEPQSSGVGGGGFLLFWDAAARRLTAYDGREAAPATATPDRFLDGRGQPLEFFEAAIGGRSVGVPGLLRMLAMAHEHHGRMAWSALFEPAIGLAENGYPISRRLHRLLADDRHLRRLPTARDYFYDRDGNPPPVGGRLTNPPLAAVLREVAAEGVEGFYSGDIAQRIVAGVRTAAINPGDLTLDDLARYQAVERPPLCGPYRIYVVCGMPPPSSGGVAVLQMLAFLEPHDLAADTPLSPATAHLLAEAGKLAFADRNRYLADPDIVPVPLPGLLDADYLAARASAIDPRRSMGPAEPGTPPGAPLGNGAAGGREPPSTTHLSVVDASGNAVALTSSIENAFGSRLMVAGMLLNNQLTDFSFRPRDDAGRPVANRVEAGKRPRSSMAPTMVFDRHHRLVAVLGSAGGPAIIGHVVQAIVALLDHRLSAQEAVALGHVLNRGSVTELESDTPAAALRDPLHAMGHAVRLGATTSGLHLIHIRNGLLLGGIDPRREGAAAGE